MKKNTAIVVGLGFGDEGKGVTTDYLCTTMKTPLVIRFSGGHQAGHTVTLQDGKSHVFSSFGSGTLRGIPTYWSQYCTLYPIGFLTEYETLLSLNTKPKIYVDALAMVTTPYDVAYNRATELANQHGSCGIGFSATVERSTLTPNRLYVEDLQYEHVLRFKLAAVKAYYDKKVAQLQNTKITEAYNYIIENNFSLEYFITTAKDIVEIIDIVHEYDILQRFDNIIFEGSQGILLDQDHGFFPHVTRAYTTTRNAMEMIIKNKLPLPTIYYITRAYQTRHGNGPMTNETMSLSLQNTEKETNQKNEWQGTFRKSPLDVDLLNYALSVDANYALQSKKCLVITCLDQIVGETLITKNGERITISTYEDLILDEHIDAVQFEQILLNNGGKAETMQTTTLSQRISCEAA